MENKDLKRGMLVEYDCEPYVVIRPDSGNMVELYPGDKLPVSLWHQSKDGVWTYSSNVTPRVRTFTFTEAELAEILQTRYEIYMDADDRPRADLILSVAYSLADKLVTSQGITEDERRALIGRLILDKPGTNLAG